MHRRRCTQLSPIFRHSSHPSERDAMGFTSFRCLHAMGSSVWCQIGSFGEDAVHELHADGAFTDRRCDALHAAGANIADCEDSRDARLEKTWRMGSVSVSLVRASRTCTRSRCPSPSSPTICLNARTVMFRLSSMRRMRYRDIVSASPGPRTRI